MRFGSILTIGFAAATLLGACESNEPAPVRVMRSFISAAKLGDRQRVFALLTPRAQAELRRRAEAANQGHRGGYRFEPHDMLAVTGRLSVARLGAVEILSQTDTSAAVKLVAANEKQSETWHLSKSGGAWRVSLP